MSTDKQKEPLAVATGSAAQRVANEWRDILNLAYNYRASIYQTTPELRDALTELARVLPNIRHEPRTE